MTVSALDPTLDVVPDRTLQPPTDTNGLGAVPQALNGLARNVLASWAGHLVFVVAGFIMPRYIDHRAGQSALGVWDFGWSLVNYLGLTQAGIGSSVNRYVSKYNAEGNSEALNRAVSSVMAVQIIASAIVVAGTLILVANVHVLLHTASADLIRDGEWVVACLGASLAVQMACSSFVGVITGCHRWDLHNLINAGFYGAIVIAMISLLTAGGGLRAISVAYFAGVIFTELTRARLAYRICPQLRVAYAHVSGAQARTMLRFGGKTFLGSISDRVLYGTNSILIAGTFGPAALALYSRPLSLVGHLSTFLSKFAFVLTPAASHLQAAGKDEDLSTLAVRSYQLSALLTLPPIVFLAIMGGPLLRVWMGQRYEATALIAVLALAHLMSIAGQPLFSVLTGMDSHGKPAIVGLIAAIASMPLTILLVRKGGLGLSGAALGIAVPLVCVYGIYLPIYAARQLRLSVGGLMRETWVKPALAAAPLVIVLGIIRAFFSERPLLAILIGAAAGASVMAPVYWRFVLPARLKQQVRSVIGRALRLAGLWRPWS